MAPVSLKRAKEIFGESFIGPEELNKLSAEINILPSADTNKKVPDIPYDESFLENVSSTHVLFLGIPYDLAGNKLTLVSLRNHFGFDPAVKEPCFYNQDWYLKEKFANTCTMEHKWYLLRKELIDSTRGKPLLRNEFDFQVLPSALVCAFAFFAFYFHSKKILWQYDFVWCNDTDDNGDRIYIGRYSDSKGLAKNGFSVHRFLSINNSYGCIDLH